VTHFHVVALTLILPKIRQAKLSQKMDPQKVKITTPAESSAYEIAIGSGLLESCGVWAKTCLPSPAKKIAVVSNKKVFGLYGAAVEKSLRRAGFKTCVWLMPDGEKYKDLNSLQKLLAFLGKEKLTRSDAILALGGGVVGDLAGFAASICLRGIPVLQVPTTLLAQIDSSVGGKTAVNTGFGKNLIGTFYQPRGVLIDVDTLGTLPPRELTAGFCEAIKQGVLAGGLLFNRTRRFLESFDPSDPARIDKIALAGLIKSQVAFKAKIVAGDQRESLLRQDGRSRKILNLGHTTAHALEKVTRYQQLKHGEAVGYGLLVAGEISKNLGFLDDNSLKSLKDVVTRAGALPPLRNITSEEIHRATVFDKKNSAGVISWVLLREIGRPVIVGDDQIPTSLIKKAIRTILK
jgi:3-dehydroquinate synthase